jgi:hypothetical protein
MKIVIINILKTIGLCSLLFFILAIIFVVFSECAHAADYSDAANHAKDAFLVQSGLQGMQDKTLNYLKNTYVDRYDWTKDIGVVVGSGYYTYRHRTVPIKITHNCKLTLSTTSIGVEYHW